jgi:hypothetical protein
MDFKTTAVAAALIIAAYSTNGRRKVLAALLIGLVGLLIARPTESALLLLVRLLYYSGAAAILIEAAVAFKRSESRDTVLQMFCAPCLVAACGLGLLVGMKLSPITLDRFLYAFDGGLGFQPGFAIAGLIARSARLQSLIAVSYLALPMAATLIWVSLERRYPTEARRFVLTCAAIGAVGWLGYCLFPAVGSRIVVASFPWVAPRIELADIIPTLAPAGPRNCMPSLHTAWVLAIWWYSRRMRLPFRAILAAYLVLTLAGTLEVHYLIDMALAVPFALAVDAGVASCHSRSLLVAGIATTCLSLFAAWLLLLRFGIRFLLLAPWASWGAVCATVAVCLALRWRLDRGCASTSVDQPEDAITGLEFGRS